MEGIFGNLVIGFAEVFIVFALEVVLSLERIFTEDASERFIQVRHSSHSS